MIIKPNRISADISPRNALKMASKLGGKLVDRTNEKGAALTLEEVQDVFKKHVPKRFIPKITTNAEEFSETLKHFGMTEAQQNTFENFMGACYFINKDMKGHSIYLPPIFFEGQPASHAIGLAHEFFHALSQGKTTQGKKALRIFRKQTTTERKETFKNLTYGVKVQDLLISSFKVAEIGNPTPETSKLYKQLRNDENRTKAFIRTILRTIFDPRLKKGEQRDISKLHLQKETSINPNGVAVRPTVQNIAENRAVLKEESKAYFVSGQVERYILGLTRDDPGVTLNQIISGVFVRAQRVLRGEKQILDRNP